MRALLRELASSAHACALDSAVINAEMRLDELATTILSSPNPAEFAARRDELTELMLELPAEQRHTPSQIYHVHHSTVARLNMPFLSFQAKNLLTQEQKRTFDHEAYGEAITQVLSEQHLEDRQRAQSNRAATKTATAAAFVATHSAASSDPRRSHLPVCSICSIKGHTANACWRNADATDERAKASAPRSSALGRCVAADISSPANYRRRNRLLPRTATSASTAAPWTVSPEGADAAIAYATSTIADDSAEDGLCYSAVGGKASPTPQPTSRVINIAVDSGVTWHLHGRRDDMSDIRACDDSIAGIDGAVQRCHGVGTLNIAVKNHVDETVQLQIRNVRLAPHANLSLLSASQLILPDGFVIALQTPAQLKTPCGSTLPLRIARGLFFLDARTGSAASDTPSQTRLCKAADGHAEWTNIEPPQDGKPGIVATFRAAHDAHASSHIAALTTDAAAAVMARRLHIGIKAVRRLPTFTTDAPPSLAKVRTNPSTTTAVTMRRLSHAETRYVESTPGRLFHMDICGPLPESKLGRFKYAMVLVDDSTRFNMGIAMRSRDEAGAHIRRFIVRFNSLAAHSQGRVSKVGTLLTDGAREFLSNAVQHLLDENGVNKIEAPPEVHALNGVAERAILSIFTRVRTHLEQSHAPKGFWPEAMSHSIDILNRVTGAPHGRCSSYESRAMVRPRIFSLGAAALGR